MKGFSKEEVTNRGQFKGRPERLVVESRLENPRLCFFLVQHLGFVAAKTNRLSHFPALFFFGAGAGGRELCDLAASMAFGLLLGWAIGFWVDEHPYI